MSYIIQTERLGLRNWLEQDKLPFYQMNSDAQVMAHFPAPLSRRQSDESYDTLRAHFEEHGYTYFATDLLETQEFIGFIGLKNQNYDYQYAPFTDIGWRLATSFWGRGYATEGAGACLRFAFGHLQAQQIYSVAAHRNLGSMNVMQKIGMTKIDEFVHPLMAAADPLQPCHCYRISRSEYLSL